MVEEFPSLKTIGAVVRDDIRVQRWTIATLEKTPYESELTGSLVACHRFDKWHAVMPDGSVVEGFVKPEYDFQSNYAYTGSRHDEGETILEALDRLIEKTGQVPIFLVNQWEDHSVIVGQDYHHEQGIVIYKPSKKTTVAEILVKAHEAASRDVAAEISF